MKTIRNVPGFVSVNPLLEESLRSKRCGLFTIIDAAKKLAAELIENCIKDEKLVNILNVPAFCDDSNKWKYDLIEDEMPPMSLLEWIICIGIDQSQSPKDDRELGALVGIKKKDLEEQTNYKPGQRFNEQFKKISDLTENFIQISPNNSTTRTDAFVFSFFCRFKQEFPGKKVSIEAEA